MEVCGTHTLTFDSDEKPTTFTIGGGGAASRLRGASSVGKNGVIDPRFSASTAKSTRWRPEDVSSHNGVKRLLGTGPWAWSGISTMAFLDEGILVTPWGQGTWHADTEDNDTLFVLFAGATHKVVAHTCHKFTSTRESDNQKVEGWIQLGGRGGGCPGGGGGGFFG